jgi:hypothetical protein
MALGNEDDNAIPADECVVCRGWPALLRPAMRIAVDAIPMTVKSEVPPICDECLLAFWSGLRGAAANH